jgi:LacI family transcriptional regulator
MKREKDFGAIFVTNSRVALVARYLREHPSGKILLIGYDYLKSNIEFLLSGHIDFLLCEKPQEQGYKGIMTLFQNLVYSTEIEREHLMPIDIITRENYMYYRN